MELLKESASPLTTPKSNPSKRYKHFRKAVAFCFRKLELYVGTAVSGRGHFQDFCPGFRFWHICHVDRHGHFTLKQLRLPVLNETHTNIYTGPRLSGITGWGRGGKSYVESHLNVFSYNFELFYSQFFPRLSVINGSFPSHT